MIINSEHGVKLEYARANRAGHLSITRGGRGLYVELDKRQRRELALEILAEDFDIHYQPGPGSTRQITLTEKRAKIAVGQFYRVISHDGMAESFMGNPLVKVISVSDNGRDFEVETITGSGSSWTDLDGLEGPLEVREETVWKLV